MRSFLSATSLLGALAAVASAKQCFNQTVPIPVIARVANFSQSTPLTNADATSFVLDLVRQGGNYTQQVLLGYTDASKTYNLSTQFCAPDNASLSSNQSGSAAVLQVLTHGIGFDRTYWDLPYNGFNYSYVKAATQAGYYTFSYDRLGIANSSHGEPNEIQAALEVGALYAMTTMLRNNSFPHITTNFSKIVHVGHSFGSTQTYALAALYPNATDGLVLTGFSTNGSFLSNFLTGGNFVQAAYNQPLRFGNLTGPGAGNDPMAAADLVGLLEQTQLADLVAGASVQLPQSQNLPLGYLVASDITANQLLFLRQANVDPGLAVYAEATKQPVTIGELLTAGVLAPTNTFAGPVLVLSGQYDVPFCGGDCLATGGALASIPADVQKSFPNVAATDFQAYIQPDTAHGINLHYNATAAYGVVTSFLGSHGLGS